MARIRSVHPSLFTDEAWVSCSPLARILYIALWTDADDQGLFEWKPLQIKMRLLPGDVADIPALLEELSGVDLIKQYEYGVMKYGAIKNFRKFQRPQKPNAIHSLPESLREYVRIDAGDKKPVDDHYDTGRGKPKQMEDGGGMMDDEAEDKSSVPKPAKPRASKRAPDGWSPSPALIAVGVEEGLSEEQIRRELAVFRDYTFSSARSDWDATFRNWLRKAAERKPNRNHADDAVTRAENAKRDQYARIAQTTGFTGEQPF